MMHLSTKAWSLCPFLAIMEIRLKYSKFFLMVTIIHVWESHYVEKFFMIKKYKAASAEMQIIFQS